MAFQSESPRGYSSASSSSPRTPGGELFSPEGYFSRNGYFSPASSGINTPSTSSSIILENSAILRQTVLVVGGLGYIGSHTSWELIKAGFNVIIIDNLSNSYRSVLDKLEALRIEKFGTQTDAPIIDFFQSDYQNQATMRGILSKYSLPPSHSTSNPKGTSSIIGVIHFAAYKAVAESFQKPLGYYANNVAGLIDFCKILSELSIKTLVFSSSATVYGELANRGGRLVEESCDNSGCSGLTSPYGRTKWMCEAILNDLAFSDPEWSIIALRYFNPIGCDSSGILPEDPRGTPNNLMPIVVNVMMGKLPVLNIFGDDWDTADGTSVRDFIHVSDLARGHVSAIKAKRKLGTGFKTFNLGTGTGHSVNEIVIAMEGVSKKRIPTRKTGRREGDVGVCIAEPSKSLLDLEWRTEKSLEDCCRDICRVLDLDE